METAVDTLCEVMVQADTFFNHSNVTVKFVSQTVLHRFVSALGGAVSNSAF